jgi:hypothetical protein
MPTARVAACAAVLGAFVAPAGASPDLAAAEAAAQQSRPSATEAAAPGMQGASRTIRLLLEMQALPPEGSGASDARAAERVRRAISERTAAASNDGFVPSSSLFSAVNASKSVGDAGAAGVNTLQWAGSVGGAQAAAFQGGPAFRPEFSRIDRGGDSALFRTPGWLREVAILVREHRVLTMTVSVLVLGAIAFGASLASRRR